MFSFMNYHRDMGKQAKQQLMGASELAKRAGVSTSYICRLCRQGKIEAVKVGNSWIIERDEAQRWLAERGEP